MSDVTPEQAANTIREGFEHWKRGRLCWSLEYDAALKVLQDAANREPEIRAWVDEERDRADAAVARAEELTQENKALRDAITEIRSEAARGWSEGLTDGGVLWRDSLADIQALALAALAAATPPDPEPGTTFLPPGAPIPNGLVGGYAPATPGTEEGE